MSPKPTIVVGFSADALIAFVATCNQLNTPCSRPECLSFVQAGRGQMHTGMRCVATYECCRQTTQSPEHGFDGRELQFRHQASAGAG